jgi:ABC-type nitrate/sulfonate/bicarbonate transport system substrate-binding protein
MPRRLALLSLVVATLVVSALAVAPGSQAQPKPKVPATLRIDWIPGSHHIGPLLSVERGYYAQEVMKGAGLEGSAPSSKFYRNVEP